MLQLALPGDYIVLIDEADQLLVAGFAWKILKSDKHDLLYAHAWQNKLHLYMHRLIIGAGPDEQVDHWNSNGLDNQRHNLRIASYSQNRVNQGKQLSRSGRMSTSQYKGVSWDKSRQKWIVAIGARDGHRSLGRYADEEQAARVYDAAALERWGQFARLNFPVDNGLVCGVHQLGIPAAPCTCERTAS